MRIFIAIATLSISLISGGQAALADTVHAQPAKACGSFGAQQAPGIHYSQVRVTSISCTSGKRIIQAWRKGLKTGTRRQRMCAPGQGITHATCTVGTYRCSATAVQIGGPANKVTCRKGTHRVSWRADFYN